MKLFIYTLVALICSASISCTKDDFLTSEESSYSAKENGDIILRQRNPELSNTQKQDKIYFDRNEYVTRDGSSSTIIGNSDKLLGYSYTFGNSILGDMINVGHQVINTEKVKNHISSKKLQLFSLDSYAYTNEESYSSVVDRSKKVSLDVGLSYCIFSASRKQTTEEIFHTQMSSHSKNVYGEMNLLYNHSAFKLDAAAAACKLYASECLSSAFVHNLYNTPIGKLIDAYGPFVLAGYITGGKACAMFSATTKDGSSGQSLEKKLQIDMEASAKWQDKSASAGYSFGKGNRSENASSYETKNVRTKLLLYGGKPQSIGMGGATDLTKVDINLDPWVASLSDINQHTMIDITQNGLVPLSSFILESNFKRRLNNTTMGLLPVYPELIEPNMVIARVFERYSKSGTALYSISPILYTRQGDMIVLSSKITANESDEELSKNSNTQVFIEKAKKIADEKGVLYENIEITARPLLYVNPMLDMPICFDFRNSNEKDMAKFVNKNTNIMYVYDSKRKIALSIYIDRLSGDYLLDTYGIRNWVKSLPDKGISMGTIADYTLIGL